MSAFEAVIPDRIDPIIHDIRLNALSLLAEEDMREKMKIAKSTEMMVIHIDDLSLPNNSKRHVGAIIRLLQILIFCLFSVEVFATS